MPDFKRIRSNVWHPNLARLRTELHEDVAAPCQCKPFSAGGASCSNGQCVNRSTQTECSDDCPCGEECENRQLQRAMSPKVKIQKFPGSKGMGAIAQEDIEADVLVCEYVGDIVDQKELWRRIQNEYQNMRHTYVMTYIRGLVIDGTQKGSWARFLNHSCEPNCCTQKWVVNGETRVGIYTQRACQAGEELTYNYNLEWNGFARVKCECGAKTCSGWLGGRKDGSQALVGLLDSDDEARDADDEGAKVTPLSMGGPSAGTTAVVAPVAQLRATAPAATADDISEPPLVETQPEFIEMDDLEELTVQEAIRRVLGQVGRAADVYPSVVDHGVPGLGLSAEEVQARIQQNWNPVQDEIEENFKQWVGTVEHMCTSFCDAVMRASDSVGS